VLQEEQVVELEETLNTQLLQSDELQHEMPTTTSSGDPEIHHHQQAHELHIVNAELLANTATITTTTNCITVSSSQSNKLGFQLLAN
jgi:hypothetical protein